MSEMNGKKKKPIATGYIRLNGKKVRVWLWENEFKQNDKHPDWHVVLRDGLFEARGGVWLKKQVEIIEDVEDTPTDTEVYPGGDAGEVS